ncbi:MAG: hypothetical protein FJ385_06630 [Verrucomicrobia bacterium]|nr:hypothetical protein [Verrucomicrobiota bacterium]
MVTLGRMFWLCSCLHAAAAPVPLVNAGFEQPVNASSSGEFGQGFTTSVPGWTLVAGDNANTTQHTSTGFISIVPAAGRQVLCLRSGGVVAQLTELKWSDLAPGSVLRLTLAAGDRAVNQPSGMPYWADESFFGLSRGLVVRAAAPGSASLNADWLGGIVARSEPVDQPPSGFKAGTMGDMSMEYLVTAADVAAGGDVGVFIASAGTRLNTSTGMDGSTGQTNFSHNQSFWDEVRLEADDFVPSPDPPPVAASGPNIVFILADDFGWTGLRAEGSGPNIIRAF